MDPEAKARQEIDRQLTLAGWVIHDLRELNLYAAQGVAVREFPLETGEADYLLYVDGRAIGVIEAKPEGHSLTGVETQSDKYLRGLPPNLPHYRAPLPFAFESNGDEIRFTNTLEPDARSRALFAFHTPKELLRLVALDEQIRGNLRNMPEINARALWPVQLEAISNLEQSLAASRPRALIQMATGSGKTFTAVNICYRLARFANAKRILFLVDRNNLGKQTLDEFQKFQCPDTQYRFTEEYPIQLLKKKTIDPAAKVCIATIQKLYRLLSGQDDDEADEADDTSLFESEAASALPKEPLPVTYNPDIPIDSFDVIIVDECHRSIYNLWRQVLDYFDAFLIGLTATPTAQTIGFFNNNLVQEYTHEKAVADGVNVGYDVYRIETEISSKGAHLRKEPGILVPHRDRRTKKKKAKELDDDLPYTPGQLDRDVVAPDQIRLVIRTFRDRLAEIFPGRREVPKTLVFAKTDLHAEDIVQIIREEFGKGNEFCQKITAKSHKPDELLQQLRTAYYPRIAVTVDMIATGTDVKPLECLLFMRNIRSLSYFEQMKGRGCRIAKPDEIQSVTPDVQAKTHFVIVDAVGVCEEEKAATRPLDRKPSVPLDKVLDLISKGAADADLVSTLAARLARLQQRVSKSDDEAITTAAGGKSLTDLSRQLLDSIDPDAVQAQAADRLQLPEGTEPTEKQVNQVEFDRMREALKPFASPKLRETILGTARSLDQVIDEVTRDTLLRAGFDAAAREKAQSVVTTFRQFIDDHKDEIEALQILYSRPYKAGLRFSQIRELAETLKRPPHSLHPERVWTAYEALEPDRVKGHGGNKLVDVVALVRHALDPDSPLAPVGLTVEERYKAWRTDQAAAGVRFTPEQDRWLEAIRDHIASNATIEQEDLEDVTFARIGGLGRAYELFGDKLTSLLDELNARLAV